MQEIPLPPGFNPNMMLLALIKALDGATVEHLATSMHRDGESAEEYEKAVTGMRRTIEKMVQLGILHIDAEKKVRLTEPGNKFLESKAPLADAQRQISITFLGAIKEMDGPTLEQLVNKIRGKGPHDLVRQLIPRIVEAGLLYVKEDRYYLTAIAEKRLQLAAAAAEEKPELSKQFGTVMIQTSDEEVLDVSEITIVSPGQPCPKESHIHSLLPHESPYQQLATAAMACTQADGIVMLVMNGSAGTDLTILSTDSGEAEIPHILEELAKKIREQQKVN